MLSKKSEINWYIKVYKAQSFPCKTVVIEKYEIVVISK